jgi:hypothetical protein
MPTPAVGVPRPHAFPSAVGSSVHRVTHAARFLLPVALAAAWLSALATPALGRAPNSVNLRATYRADASIQWSAGTMDVASVARVHNDTGADIDALTFNLAAQRIGTIVLGDVLIDGQPATVLVSGQSLIVTLPAPLADGDATRVSITYHATFNSTPSGDHYLFMQYRGTLTAYRWIPWLSRAQKFDRRSERESWVTGVSPQVDVTITSDQAIDIAASGQRTSDGGGTTQTFSATNVRDFNFSAAPKYRIWTTTWNGITIRLFYRKLAPHFVMRWAIRALERYTSEVGPYPYPTLDIGEIPTGVGMESPGMVWIDSSLPRARLPYIITHELAHEWFYAVVGNNQGFDPFMDEALADFLSRDLLNEWQTSRCAQQELDGSVYDYSRFCYYEVVYVQGSNYLHDYMQQVGADAFWQGLQSFYADNQFGIAGTRALWQELDAASGRVSAEHADRFPKYF